MKKAEEVAPILVDLAKMDTLCQLSDEISDPAKAASMIEELFAVCHEEAWKSLALLARSAAQLDGRSAAAEAHKLRGICLELGLVAMASLADTIECHAEETPALLPELVRRLELCYAQTCMTLDQIFKDFAAPQ